MSPFLKGPYESPLEEVLNAGRNAVVFYREFILISLIPFALLLGAAAVSSLAPLQSLSIIPSSVIATQMASQAISLVAQALLGVRVYRFVFLGEGHGATTPPPFVFGVREGLFLAYRLALLATPLILTVLGLLGFAPFLILLALLAWFVFVWRLEFLFIDIALDKAVHIPGTWGQMGPVFGTYLLTLLSSLLVAVPIFLGAVFITALLGALKMGFLGTVAIAVAQLAITILVSLITARFYGRQVGAS